MRLDEKLRRDLIAAWEDADTLDEALVNIQTAIDQARPARLPIEERTFGGYDLNVYSNPQNCGLELLGCANKEPDYDFDMVILLRDLESGRFFMTADSGCSCPTPFENTLNVSDLTEVRTRREAQQFITSNVPLGGFDDGLDGLLRAIRDNLPTYGG